MLDTLGLWISPENKQVNITFYINKRRPPRRIHLWGCQETEEMVELAWMKSSKNTQYFYCLTKRFNIEANILDTRIPPPQKKLITLVVGPQVIRKLIDQSITIHKLGGYGSRDPSTLKLFLSPKHHSLPEILIMFFCSSFGLSHSRC